MGQLLLLLLEVLDLPVQILDELCGLPDLVLFVGGVKGLLQIEGVSALGHQVLVLRLGRGLLLVAETGLPALFRLQLQDLLIDARSGLQLGGLVELVQRLADQPVGNRRQPHVGIGQLLIVEDDAAVIDKAIGIQHPGKGLGKHAFTGAGLAYDGDGFILINIQGDSPDGCQHPAAHPELDPEVIDGQQNLFLFCHIHSPLHVRPRIGRIAQVLTDHVQHHSNNG